MLYSVKRESIILPVVALISLLGGFGLFHLTSPTETTEARETPETVLSAIPFTDRAGQQTLLSNWQQPVLVINFWAPWCAPCRREIPALIKIQEKYGDQVQIIGLALDSAENVQSFESDFAMNYPTFVAGSNIPMYNAAFNNKSGSLPHTAIVNQERILSYSHTGEITEAQLRTEIDRLFAD